MSRFRFVALLPTLALCAPVAQAQFASRVLNYDPAPGQFVSSSTFNDPARALGPPAGAGGLSAPDNAKAVTLGGFGGSITLAFDTPVWRNPHNPRGMDFIVYSNAFFAAGDPTRRFAEPGVIEISRDDNNNSLADDLWYLIPGSHLAAPFARTTKTYDAAALNPLWVPPGRTGSWIVSAYRLTGAPFSARPPYLNAAAPAESLFGYADLMPTSVLGDADGDDLPDDLGATPAHFYTRPDDPLVVGVTPGTGGGSNVAIAWGVDPATGAAANLDRVHFVRITTGVDLVDSLLGEVSTEISAITDVSPVYTPDWNHDAIVSVQDVFDFLRDFFAGMGEGGGADFSASGTTTVQDIFDFLTAWFSA